MIKAAFIDHSFHKLTHCTDFLKELLSERFELTYYFDESWKGGDAVDIDELNRQNFEYIFYFQCIHSSKLLRRIKNSMIVFFPMEDSFLFLKISDWLQLGAISIKIVCFSSAVFKMLKRYNLDCFYIQFFLNPNTLKIVTDFSNKRIHFWNRTSGINWKLIKKILGDNKIESFTFMSAPDPSYTPELPDQFDRKKYNMTVLNGFLEKNDYNKLVSDANIYFAPRRYEGIGMSFLEALARGQSVIASNSMTMNEYIVHGVNGYLYDIDNPRELDLSDFETVAAEARRRSILGFETWEKEKYKMIGYIISDYRISKFKRIILIISAICLFPFDRVFYLILVIKRNGLSYTIKHLWDYLICKKVKKI